MKNPILLQGGLGNQMFQYAFYLYVSQYIDTSCDKSLYKINAQHNNCELDKVFCINGIKNIFSTLLLRFFFNKFNSTKMSEFLIRMYGYHLVSDSINVMVDIKKKKCIFKGYWQSYKYIIPIQKELKNVFRFRLELLNNETITIANKINTCNSVSIHIRRGDYLNFSSLYGGICTPEYYSNSIKYIKDKISDPVFFIFSDDPTWAVEHLEIQSPTYVVDCNRGRNSWQDMYLMSLCSHNIIANSTFSWWAAWLNDNLSKIVISPSKFDNLNTTDLVYPEWVII